MALSSILSARKLYVLLFMEKKLPLHTLKLVLYYDNAQLSGNLIMLNYQMT